MEFIFSNHSKEQMKNRSISSSVVKNIISEPDKIIKPEKCLSVYQKVIPEQNKKYLYRVFINKCKKPVLIITVYKTSKTDKYEDQI
jgi:hypothetical protein